jgi:hypothetical protein
MQERRLTKEQLKARNLDFLRSYVLTNEEHLQIWEIIKKCNERVRPVLKKYK